MFTLFDNPQNNSAQLFLNGPLNFESTESYSLESTLLTSIKALESSVDLTQVTCAHITDTLIILILTAACTLRSSTTVDIQVIDVNDNIPVFSKSLYEGGQCSSIT